MVSVIIPNYNHASYLEQRIESVLNQTWKDFEVIILDDCSTDNSREIIEKYRSHQKVTSILYNNKNSGNTFKQWVTGIELCKSEFVWIAESDDWCEPSFLENIIRGMLADARCIVGFCQSYCVQGANVIKWKSDFPYLSKMIEGEDFIKRFMLLNTAIFNASMAVWRRSAFNDISKEFAHYKYCGDWLFWIELCRLGTVFISGKLLNYFRKHDNDVSGPAVLVGDNFTEELTMFNLLYKRGWILNDEYYKILKHCYTQYKAVSNTFTADKNGQIGALFASVPGVLPMLKRHYWSFKLKNMVNKILNGFCYKEK